MTDTVIFHMWNPIRDGLIESHRFFVAEAQKRLLEQFSDAAMKTDAERHMNDWLAKNAMRFDPNSHDDGSVQERAYYENVNYYLSLEKLRDTTRLSIIASMYHEWEKHLRHWLTEELGRHVSGNNTQQAIWQQQVERLFDFLESCKWPIRSKFYYRHLYQCQLVVNVYKHGAGTSFDALKNDAPQFVRRRAEMPSWLPYEPDYTDLKVDDTALESFSVAIINFWSDLPEHIFQSQINGEPSWFLKALAKDVEARKVV